MILFNVLADGPCWKCGNRFPLCELTVTHHEGTWTGYLCTDCERN